MSKALKTTLIIGGLLIGGLTFFWLASFLFRVFMSFPSDGKALFAQGFTLTDRVTSWPFDIWYYQKQYGSIYEKQLKFAWMVSGFVHFAIFLIVGALMQKKQSLYGDARFAKPNEIQKANLFISPKELKQDGFFAGTKILVGKFGGRYLGLGGQQFVYLAAPTRSGKGVSVVIPVALSYSDSLVINDIKQEIFHYTAAYRAKQGHEIYLFNPFDAEGRTSRWNPFSYINRSETQRVDDINQIAICLIPNSSSSDTFFEESARRLFIGLTLYCLDKEKHYQSQKMIYTPTIREVLDLATDFNGEAIPHFSSLMSDPFVSVLAKQTINSAISAGDKTFASILATLNANLTPWLSEPVVNATSADDFDLRDLRKKRMTIYVGILPKDLLKAAKIINLFFSQLINANTSELPQNNPALKYQCLLLLDEATAPGRIEILEKAVSYMAGYNMRLLFVAQSFHQLSDNSVYGEHGTRNLLTNMALKILFTPNDPTDAKQYSEVLGKITIKEDTSKSRGGGNRGVSRTETQNQRDLMMPQELMAMDKSKEIIRYDGVSYAIQADKITYYKDPIFKKRYLKQGKPVVPLLKDRPVTKEQQSVMARQCIKSAIKKKAEALESNIEKKLQDIVKVDVLTDFIGLTLARNTINTDEAE